MKKLNLTLRKQTHPIYIGEGILVSAVLKGVQNLKSSQGMLFADRKLKSKALELKQALKQAGWEISILFFDVTEELKSFPSVYPLYGKLLKAGITRHAVLFALGGGVIGDLAGFVAATYLRGIQWVSLPTTLLAQVDSGIGGKTGVNHESGKNLIGVFHQPSFIVCDSQFIKTLGRRDRISGLGEMIKYGLIADRALFSLLKNRWQELIRLKTAQEMKLLTRTLEKCIRIKLKTIEKDEFDRLGKREILNFGHTLGHALEAGAGYGVYRHGEAIIQGMRAAIYLSQKQGYLPQKEASEIQTFLSALPVPQLPPSLTYTKLLKYLKQDKKQDQTGKIRFILLKKIGQPAINSHINNQSLKNTHKFLSTPQRAGKNILWGE